LASISEHERELAENLLFQHPPKKVDAENPRAEMLKNAPADWREQNKEQRAAINQFHIAAITEHFEQQRRKTRCERDLAAGPRLANYIVQGTRDGLNRGSG